MWSSANLQLLRASIGLDLSAAPRVFLDRLVLFICLAIQGGSFYYFLFFINSIKSAIQELLLLIICNNLSMLEMLVQTAMLAISGANMDEVRDTRLSLLQDRLLSHEHVSIRYLRLEGVVHGRCRLHSDVCVDAAAFVLGESGRHRRVNRAQQAACARQLLFGEG